MITNQASCFQFSTNTCLEATLQKTRKEKRGALPSGASIPVSEPMWPSLSETHAEGPWRLPNEDTCKAVKT